MIVNFIDRILMQFALNRCLCFQKKPMTDKTFYLNLYMYIQVDLSTL